MGHLINSALETLDREFNRDPTLRISDVHAIKSKILIDCSIFEEPKVSVIFSAFDLFIYVDTLAQIRVHADYTRAMFQRASVRPWQRVFEIPQTYRARLECQT